LVSDVLEQGERFFDAVERACDELHRDQRSRASLKERDFAGGGRNWTELRIRQPELVPDNITLPIQRLRESVSDLIKMGSDKEIAQELTECNRRLGELHDEIVTFLNEGARDH